MTSLREKWTAGDETLGVWLAVPSPFTAEIAAREAVDYVCVDLQHGVNDYQVATAMIAAIELGGPTPIARVPWNEPGIIGKVLDAGAHGVIVPMVNTRAQAEAVVRACRYAPEGTRSWGPVIASVRHPDYRAWADATVACIPMIETVEALGNLDEILSVPGVDAIYVGPNDLAVSLGLQAGVNDGIAVFDDALAAILDGCKRHGVVPGIHSSGPLTPRRREQGFRMITVASDAVAMRAGIRSELAAAQGDGAAGGGEPGKFY